MGVYMCVCVCALVFISNHYHSRVYNQWTLASFFGNHYIYSLGFQLSYESGVIGMPSEAPASPETGAKYAADRGTGLKNLPDFVPHILNVKLFIRQNYDTRYDPQGDGC